MRITALILALVVSQMACLSTVNAQLTGPAIEFAVPARLAHQATVENGHWIVISFDEASRAVGQVLLPNSSYKLERESEIYVSESLVGSHHPQRITQTTSVEESVRFSADIFASGPASLFIEAEYLKLSINETENFLTSRKPGSCLEGRLSPYADEERTGRYDAICPAGKVGLIASPISKSLGFAIHATGITRLEYHNVGITCSAGPESACAGAADRDSANYSAGPSSLGSRTFLFHNFLSNVGEFRLEGAASDVAAGGDVFNLRTNGTSRFPLASLSSTCDACLVTENQTLILEGEIELMGLKNAENGRLSSHLAGNITVARIDEMLVDPTRILGKVAGVAAAAAVSAFLVLKLLFAPLFTRLTKEQALEHPRRKQIFEYIQQHPGANFREVARRTGIAAGTVRHHLNVLERSGQVVEHSHGSTVRLFENHGKFDHNWSDLVLLREPALGKLYDWLKAHPNSPQKAVLEAMEAQQWSRSTTQHRLSRLVDGGVASVRLQGRLKMYSIVDRPVAAKPPGLSVPTRSAYPAPLS